MSELDTHGHDAQIFAYLKRLHAEGGDDNFLIVSCGDAYVQCLRVVDDSQLYCEAVSNAKLPRQQQLSDAQIARLLQYGFGSPSPSNNFSCTLRVADERALHDIARLLALVLSDVYHCDPAAPWEYELNS